MQILEDLDFWVIFMINNRNLLQNFYKISAFCREILDPLINLRISNTRINICPFGKNNPTCLTFDWIDGGALFDWEWGKNAGSPIYPQREYIHNSNLPPNLTYTIRPLVHVNSVAFPLIRGSKKKSCICHGTTKSGIKLQTLRIKFSVE